MLERANAAHVSRHFAVIIADSSIVAAAVIQRFIASSLATETSRHKYNEQISWACVTMARNSERCVFASKLTLTTTVISKSVYLSVKSVRDAKARPPMKTEFLEPKENARFYLLCNRVAMQHAAEHKLRLRS